MQKLPQNVCNTGFFCYSAVITSKIVSKTVACNSVLERKPISQYWLVLINHSEFAGDKHHKLFFGIFDIFCSMANVESEMILPLEILLENNWHNEKP